MIRTEARFKGYYKQPDKTGEALDVEGWYYTGDAGHMDEKTGHLIYLERVKDLIELSTGEKFSPQYIEGRTKFSPYVQDMMTIGGMDMEFVSAIIVIDFQNVSRWAEKQRYRLYYIRRPVAAGRSLRHHPAGAARGQRVAAGLFTG